MRLSLSLRRLESLHIQGNGIKRLPHTVVNLKKINSLLVLPNPIEVRIFTPVAHLPSLVLIAHHRMHPTLIHVTYSHPSHRN
jgi:hypothetical protein